MGALTTRMLAGEVRYEVGGKPGSPLEFLELVNQAGEFLVACHPWRWLEGRALTLRRRPRVEITNATWTEGTLTLTEVGAFATYDHLPGDTLDSVSGTDVTEGTYEVASRVDDDSITLRTSIGALATTGIEGRLPNDQIELSPDFDLQQVIGIETVDGTVSSFDWTMAQGMLGLRSWPGLRSTTSFWGWLNYVRLRTGGAPSLRMEVWPDSPDAAEFVRIFYRGGWLAVTSDTMELSIPQHMNRLFTEMVKSLASGIEDPEAGSVDARLAAVQTGALFLAAINRDAAVQPDYGYMEGGWLGQITGRVGRYDVPAPLALPEQ